MAGMTTRQVLPFTVAPQKADGTPGEVQAGSLVYASSDETVIHVGNLSTDELTGQVIPVAAGGPARFTVTADADLGAGVVTITGVSEDITVTTDPADMATTFTITFGPPQPKP